MESRSVEFDKLILQNEGNSIDMIFDKEGGMWRAVGDHLGKFNNLIGQCTRDVVPPHYPSWEKVLLELK